VDGARLAVAAGESRFSCRKIDTLFRRRDAIGLLGDSDDMRYRDSVSHYRGKHRGDRKSKRVSDQKVDLLPMAIALKKQPFGPCDNQNASLVWRTCHGDNVRHVSVLLELYADGGYRGPMFRAALKKIMAQVNVEIVKRSDQANAFVVPPRR
jgi:hypothetical protein